MFRIGLHEDGQQVALFKTSYGVLEENTKITSWYPSLEHLESYVPRIGNLTPHEKEAAKHEITNAMGRRAIMGPKTIDGSPQKWL